MADERKPMANIPPFGLRMQPELKARLEEAAKANTRSLNAEIVQRLEQSFADYMTLSGEGLAQVLKQATSVTEALWEMFFFQREVELDGWIADQAKQGRVMTKPDAIAFILRDYLKGQGYVFEPPERRPGLAGALSGGAFETVKSLVDLKGVHADPERTPQIMVDLEDAARKGIERKLASMEKSGLVRRSARKNDAS